MTDFLEVADQIDALLKKRGTADDIPPTPLGSAAGQDDPWGQTAANIEGLLKRRGDREDIPGSLSLGVIPPDLRPKSPDQVPLANAALRAGVEIANLAGTAARVVPQAGRALSDVMSPDPERPLPAPEPGHLALERLRSLYAVKKDPYAAREFYKRNPDQRRELAGALRDVLTDLGPGDDAKGAPLHAYQQRQLVNWATEVMGGEPLSRQQSRAKAKSDWLAEQADRARWYYGSKPENLEPVLAQVRDDYEKRWGPWTPEEDGAFANMLRAAGEGRLEAQKGDVRKGFLRTALLSPVLNILVGGKEGPSAMRKAFVTPTVKRLAGQEVTDEGIDAFAKPSEAGAVNERAHQRFVGAVAKEAERAKPEPFIREAVTAGVEGMGFGMGITPGAAIADRAFTDWSALDEAKRRQVSTVFQQGVRDRMPWLHKQLVEGAGVGGQIAGAAMVGGTSRLGILGATFMPSAEGHYVELIGDGVDETTALYGAVVAGFAESALESYMPDPLGLGSRGAMGTTFRQTVARATKDAFRRFGTEWSEEIAQGVATEAVKEWARDYAKTDTQKGLAQAVLDGLKEGAGTAVPLGIAMLPTGLGGVGKAASRHKMVAERARKQAEQFADAAGLTGDTRKSLVDEIVQRAVSAQSQAEEEAIREQEAREADEWAIKKQNFFDALAPPKRKTASFTPFGMAPTPFTKEQSSAQQESQAAQPDGNGRPPGGPAVDEGTRGQGPQPTGGPGVPPGGQTPGQVPGEEVTPPEPVVPPGQTPRAGDHETLTISNKKMAEEQAGYWRRSGFVVTVTEKKGLFGSKWIVEAKSPWKTDEERDEAIRQWEEKQKTGTPPTATPEQRAQSFWEGGTGNARREWLGEDIEGIARKAWTDLTPDQQRRVMEKLGITPTSPGTPPTGTGVQPTWKLNVDVGDTIQMANGETWKLLELVDPRTGAWRVETPRGETTTTNGTLISQSVPGSVRYTVRETPPQSTDTTSVGEFKPGMVVQLADGPATLISRDPERPNIWTLKTADGATRVLGEATIRSAMVAAGEGAPPSAPPSTPKDERGEAVNRAVEDAKIWGIWVTPRPASGAVEEDVSSFLDSLGVPHSFVDTDDPTFAGYAIKGEGGAVLLRGQPEDDLWGTVGHELAHRGKLDEILGASEEEMEEARQGRLKKAQGKVLGMLQRDATLLNREARADIVGRFMRDKAFRERLRVKKPTVWQKIKEAVLTFLGKWEPKDVVAQQVLAELRNVGAQEQGPKKAGALDLPGLVNTHLVELHKAAANAMFGRGVQDADRQDLEQSAIVHLLEQGDKFDPTKDFLPWAKTVIRNFVNGRLSKKGPKSEPLSDEPPAPDEDEPDEDLPDIEEYRELVGLLPERLRPWYKALLDRKGGKALRDIAAEMGVDTRKLHDWFQQVETALAEARAKKAADKAGPRDYGTVQHPNRIALGEYFAEQLDAGKKYGSILQAREEAGKLLGGHVTAGKQVAKDVDEAMEQGVVRAARKIIYQAASPQKTFDALLDLYNRQPNLSVRTSTSMQQQAYSTPAPLAYLVDQLADQNAGEVSYDATAGNGMLLIGNNPQNTRANELNPGRAAALKAQGIPTTQQDATKYRPTEQVDAILLNPPFSTVPDEKGNPTVWTIEGVTTNQVDHAIVLNSLPAMKSDGTAVLILGAKGGEPRSQEPEAQNAKAKAYLSHRAFYEWLYDNYNVVDHFTVSGDLYARQGASFPVDVIVIRGRGKSQRAKPWNILAGALPQVLTSWEELKNEKLAARYEGTMGVEPGKRGPGGPTVPAPHGNGPGNVPTPSPTPGGLDGGVGGRPEGSAEGGEGGVGGTGQQPGTGPGVSGGQRGGHGGTGRPGIPAPGGERPGRGGVGTPPVGPGGLGGTTPAGGARPTIDITKMSPEQLAEWLRSQQPGQTPEGGESSQQFNPGDRVEYKYRHRATGEIVVVQGRIQSIDRDNGTAQVTLDGAGPETHQELLVDLSPAPPDRTDDLDWLAKTAKPGDMDVYEALLDRGARVESGGWGRIDIFAPDGMLARGYIGDAEGAWKALREEAGSILAHWPAKKKRKPQPRPPQGPPKTPPKSPPPAPPKSPPTGPSPAPTEEKTGVEKAKERLKKAAEDFRKRAGKTFAIAADPELVAAAIELTSAAVGLAVQEAKVAIYKFSSFVSDLLDMIDKEMLLRTAKYIEEAWNMLRAADTSGFLGPSDSIERLLETLSPQAIESEDNEYQVGYKPGSAHKSLDTLTPRNHVAAVLRALKAVQEEHGDLDEFVAKELGFTPAQLADAFAAEQVDALALAIHNHQKGAAFILGDQTGVGKGRVVAGMLEYARRIGAIPVFCTDKAGLFTDIVRDLTDIGLHTTENPFVFTATNALSGDDVIVLPDDTVVSQSAQKARRLVEEAVANFENGKGLAVTQDGKLRRVAAIFTTYSQLQPVNNQGTWRSALMRRIAPHSYFMFDESHLAGGQQPKGNQARGGRAGLVRRVAAEARGVLFSSATWAKRSDVLDLYARTDMSRAVANPSQLGEAIARGGVPLQQVTSEMLVEAGQMLRRERNYAGINFQPEVVETDLNNADRLAGTFRVINDFDRAKRPDVARLATRFISGGGGIAYDPSSGNGNVVGTNFASTLWNLVDNMLLALKADAVVDAAIKAVEAGESPVIAVDNTLEASLKNFLKEFPAITGQAVDYSFRDLLRRYLKRSRMVHVKPDLKNKSTWFWYYMTDSDLSATSLALYQRAERIVEAFESDIPASPIDWMRYRLEKAGLQVGEITGRNVIVEYGPNGTILRQRDKKEKGNRGKRRIINGFNNGSIQVLILNRSGATGISLHASEKFKNQKKRRMLIAQSAKNIDEFMQIIGRINRTGQVNLPEYTLLLTNVPAELRPAAVLVKKLASLNANVTGGAKGAVGFDVPDIMNKVGDWAVAQVMIENTQMHLDLGLPLDDGQGGVQIEVDGARKVSGKVSLLPVPQQQQFWDDITHVFRQRIEELNNLGQNPLHAQLLHLDARPIDKETIFAGVEGSSNPFEQPAELERFNVRTVGKAWSSKEVEERLLATFGLEARRESTGRRLWLEESGKLKPVGQGLDALPDAQAAWVRDTTRKLRDDLTPYAEKKISEAATPTAAQNLENLFDGQFSRVSQAIRDYAPGTAVTVEAWFGEIPGVVISVESKATKSGSPSAPSKWIVNVAVASPARKISFPVSQLRARTDKDEPDFTGIFPSHEDLPDVLPAFDESLLNAREERYIATGNILAAFDRLRDARGQIVFFSDENGEVRRGVLMPQNFDPATWRAGQAQQVTDANEAIRSLIEDDVTLRTEDGLLELFMDHRRNGLVLRAPGGRRGRKYTTDPGILRAARPDDFISSGDHMDLLVTHDKYHAVLEAVLALGPLQVVATAQPQQPGGRGGRGGRRRGGGHNAHVRRPAPRTDHFAFDREDSLAVQGIKPFEDPEALDLWIARAEQAAAELSNADFARWALEYLGITVEPPKAGMLKQVRDTLQWARTTAVQTAFTAEERARVAGAPTVQALVRAVRTLGGKYNLATLADVRESGVFRNMPLEAFHALVQEARKQGLLTASRQDIAPKSVAEGFRIHDAGIQEGEERLTHISLSDTASLEEGQIAEGRMGKTGFGAPVAMEAESEGVAIGTMHVLKTLEKIFGTPIRIGWMRGGKRVEGKYDRWWQVAAVKGRDGAAVDAAAHEVAHHLENTTDIIRTPKGKLGGLPAAVKTELEGHDYEPDKGRLDEGFSEFVRKYLTEAEDLKVTSPATLAYWKNWLQKHPDWKKKIASAKEVIDHWRMEGAEARIMGQQADLAEEAEARNSRVSDWLRDVTNRFVNFVYYVFKQETRYAKLYLDDLKRRGYKPAPGESFFDWLTAFAQAGPYMADRARKYGVFKLTGRMEQVGPALFDISKHIKEEDLPHFTAFALAQHALTSKTWKDPGFSKADAQEVYNRYKGHANYVAAAKLLTDINNARLAVLVDAGVIDAKSAALWMKLYPNYVPLKRVRPSWRDRVGLTKGGGNRSVVNLPEAVHRRVGSIRRIVNPILSTMQQLQEAYELAARQQIGEKMIKAGLETGKINPKVPAKRMWIQPVPPRLIRTVTRISEVWSTVAGALEETGMTPEELDELKKAMQDEGNFDDIVTIFRPNFFYVGPDPVVRLRINGKPKMYMLDKGLMASLGALERYKVHPILDHTIGAATRLTKLGATGLNVDFGLLTNLIKDYQNFLMQREHSKGLKEGFEPLLMVGAYIYSHWQEHQGNVGDPIVRLWEAAGGPLGKRLALDYRRGVKRALREAVRGHEVWNPIDTFRDMVGIMEVGPRLAEFAAAMRSHGWTRERIAREGDPPIDVLVAAVNAAHEVTIDFRRMGSFGKFLNEMIPYFNAALEGVDKGIRVTRKHPWQTALRFGLYYLIGSFLYWDRNKDRDWYKERKSWQDAYWVLTDRDLGVGDTDMPYWRIPRSQEWGTIASGVEAMFDSIYQGDPDAMKRWGWFAAERFAPPYAFGGAAIVEAAINYDFTFRFRPVVGEGMEGVLPKDQYFAYTGELAKLMGKWGISPARIEHALDGTTGGMYGRYVKPIEKLVTGQGVELGDGDVPLWRAVTLRKPYGRSVDEFYAALEEAKEQAGSAALHKETQTPEAEERLKRLQQAAGTMRGLRHRQEGASKAERDALDLAIIGEAREALGKAPLPLYPAPESGEAETIRQENRKPRKK